MAHQPAHVLAALPAQWPHHAQPEKAGAQLQHVIIILTVLGAVVAKLI